MIFNVSLAAIFFCCLFKAVWWGIGENRHFSETGKITAPGFLHFSSYHLWMFQLFFIVDLGFVTAINYFFYTASIINGVSVFVSAQIILLAFFLIYDILILDVTWWVIRYLDITRLGGEWRLWRWTLWRFPTVNFYDYGDGQPWHSREDWDAAGLPLWKGAYSWWWIFTFSLVVLAVNYLYVLVSL